MGIRDDIQEVLGLQGNYSPDGTEAMDRRGDILRNSIPRAVRSIANELLSSARIEVDDFLVKGSNGLTRRSLVPWVRFGSRKRSPTATKGWYVVLLFRGDGSGAYLALAHASNESNGSSFVSRSASEATALTRWARELIFDKVRDKDRLVDQIELRGKKLSKSYERTTATSFFYSIDDVPSDEQIATDMNFMSQLLGDLYDAEGAQKRTQETSLEVISALEAVEENVTGRRASGKAIGLTAPERRAVEMRAMHAAIEHFTAQGYTVEDTSATKPYDLMAARGGTTLYIEVKGTTGLVGEVVLTRNEVEHHLKHYPENALFVLSEIRLLRSQTGPHASGGRSLILTPWKVEGCRLEPIAYKYRVE